MRLTARRPRRQSNPATRSPGRVGSWLISALVVGLLLGACSGDDTHLPALLADPMADYEAEGIELVDAWERAEGRDWFFRKPTHAEAFRTYRILDQSQADQLLEGAVAYAQANGWRIQRDMTVSTLFVGVKATEAGDARLGIALAASDPLHDPDGPQGLTIHLDFGSVRLDETTTSTVKGG